jgi:prepilin-type N-terminal cleavage/methylation domain-containing protein
MTADRGFSLVELLIATALALLISGALAAALNPSRLIAESQAEAMDMQQGARFAVAALRRDLELAGAGPERGAGAGPLVNHLPPILPRRIGARDADPVATARSDAFSILWVPRTTAQATLDGPLDTGRLVVSPATACLPASMGCGFGDGMGVIVFDDTGRFDLFTATVADATGVSVRRRAAGTAAPYPSGSAAAEVTARTWYFDPAARQLRQYDTDTTDTPALDDVVAMKVEYFGRPDAPSQPRPPAGVANCLYDSAGTPLPFPGVGVSGDTFVAIPLEQFTNGPWCGAGGVEFDADLLRVRRVRVTLTLQASSRAMRGRGAGFVSSGTNVSVWNRLADLVVVIDTAPRNFRLADR